MMIFLKNHVEHVSLNIQFKLGVIKIESNAALHILNGQGMYNFFRKTHFLKGERMIPFNEAMCYGDTTDDLFSREFIEIRANVHHVTLKQYEEITLKPLLPFFNKGFNHLVLWFDADMFCQINLLTLLAWLDRSDYQDPIELHIVNEQYETMWNTTLKAKGYYSIYNQVLIHKMMPENVNPFYLKKGIELYLNYLNKDSELMQYIEKHQNESPDELLLKLFDRFREYGLGDTQYLEIIKSFQKNNN